MISVPSSSFTGRRSCRRTLRGVQTARQIRLTGAQRLRRDPAFAVPEAKSIMPLGQPRAMGVGDQRTVVIIGKNNTQSAGRLGSAEPWSAADPVHALLR